ncbi:MAG: AAA family ATPase [Elusimicrobiota bacterium]|jgi:predicted AAA+ superfamily ATPase|nr:AAA family ATPase [Elusimicrobiota bacterium]
MEFNKLIELNRLSKESTQQYAKHRKLYDELISDNGKHFVGIIGPRGVGKTITLKQLALDLPNSFYISMETFDGNMFDVLKELKEKLKIENFFLDEVHSYDKFDKEIQSVYELLNIKVFFTSSTALSMSKYKNDLSRRVILKYLYPFSLKEYIEFNNSNSQVPVLSFDDFINNELPADFLQFSQYFYPYIKGGLMPFALDEPDIMPLLSNILNTVIYKDIPKINGNISMEELSIINKLVKFAAMSNVDGLNYSSIAKNLGITKYKSEQYISLLEQAFILQAVFPQGTNLLKEPKILLSLPYRLLYKDFDYAIGGLREDFFVQTCKILRKKISYLKSMMGAKTPDYILTDENIVLEIGAKGKGRQQFKGIKTDKKIILADSYEYNTIDKKPLFAFGLIEN